MLACALPILAFVVVLPALGLLRGAIDNYESESKRRILDVNGHLLVLAYSRTYDWQRAEDAVSALSGVVQIERFSIDSTLVASGGRNHPMLVSTFDAGSSEGRKRLARYLTAGALPHAGAARPELLIGHRAAEQLQVKVGDSLHVLAPPAWPLSAQRAGETFEAVVVGIFGYDYSQYDDKLALLPFDDVLKLGGATTGVRGWWQDPNQAEAEAAPLARKLGDKASVLSWRKLNTSMFEALDNQRRMVETPSNLGLAVVAFVVLVPAVAFAWACLRGRRLGHPLLLAAGLGLVSMLPGSLVALAAAERVVPLRTGAAYFGVVLRELSPWPTLGTAACLAAAAVALGAGLSRALALSAKWAWWPLLLTPVLLTAAAGGGALQAALGMSQRVFDGFLAGVRAREGKVGVDLVVSGVPLEQARTTVLRAPGVKAAHVRHRGSGLGVALGATAELSFDALAPADARALRPWLDWETLEQRSADTTGAEAVQDNARAWERLVDEVSRPQGGAEPPDEQTASLTQRPIAVFAGNSFSNALQVGHDDWFRIKVILADGKVRTTPARLVDSFSIGLDQPDARTLFALQNDADEALGPTRRADLVVKLAADASPALVAAELRRQLGPTAGVTESWAEVERDLRFEADVSKWCGTAISIALWLSVALVFALLGLRHHHESRKVRCWRLSIGAGLTLAASSVGWLALTTWGALLARWTATSHVQLPAGLAAGFADTPHMLLLLPLTALAALPGLALATRSDDEATRPLTR